MITGPDQLPAPIAQTFIKRLLSIPVPSLIHKKFAMLETMPRHGGKTVRFRRMNKLATAKVPLGTSGLDPAPQVLSAIDIDATMSFYGTFIQMHEQVVLQNQDRPLTQAAEVLGISLRMTEDELTRDMLASTASAVNATGGVNGIAVA